MAIFQGNQNDFCSELFVATVRGTFIHFQTTTELQKSPCRLQRYDCACMPGLPFRLRVFLVHSREFSHVCPSAACVWMRRAKHSSSGVCACDVSCRFVFVSDLCSSARMYRFSGRRDCVYLLRMRLVCDLYLAV